ncbi:hypothetical protein HPT27_14530 [Permianibacter sp. IMCC34836]|uniref:DUF6498-containing protein n=1 Tax=Permianibacter fluminis TaxID=2738515 RepID=UPI0015538EF2|nr:DUF6498-containing protein [Permianibacter fluminis]NQD38241.1 hypothetical protein [Permianibacter fluminis]
MAVKLRLTCVACGSRYVHAAEVARQSTILLSQRVKDRREILGLVLVNCLVLAAAIFGGWSNFSLMLTYWAQSVLIGISNAVRILRLQRFDSVGVRYDEGIRELANREKRKCIVSFLSHYLFFCLLHLVFLLVLGKGLYAVDLFFGLCLIALVFELMLEHRQQVTVDRQTVPNLGLMFITPYMRIIPMHLVIIFAGQALDSLGGMLLFGLLKTAADVGMLLVAQGPRRKSLGQHCAELSQTG